MANTEHPNTETPNPQRAGPADISVWIERLTRRPVSRRESSPDLLRQLRQTLRRPVNRVLCIGADADPSLRLLSAMSSVHAADVRRGLHIVQEMTGRRITFVDAGHVRRRPYPAAHPSLLIREQFGRKLRPGRLPTDVGVLLLDTITAVEVAMLERDRSLDLPLVIDDHTTGLRHRLTVPATTPLAEVFDSTGLVWQSVRLFEGPPLRRLPADPTRCVGAGELWLHLEPALGPALSTACTRCGDCVNACPVNLHPAALFEAAQADDFDMAHAFSATACIDCGLCTHVCPSRLPVMEAIRKFKRPQTGVVS